MLFGWCRNVLFFRVQFCGNRGVVGSVPDCRFGRVGRHVYAHLPRGQGARGGAPTTSIHQTAVAVGCLGDPSSDPGISCHWYDIKPYQSGRHEPHQSGQNEPHQSGQNSVSVLLHFVFRMVFCGNCRGLGTWLWNHARVAGNSRGRRGGHTFILRTIESRIKRSGRQRVEFI